MSPPSDPRAPRYETQYPMMLHGRFPPAHVNKQVIPFTGCDEREDPFAWIFEHFETVRNRYRWIGEACLRIVNRYLLRTALSWLTANRHKITHWRSRERHCGYQPGSFIHAFLARFIRPEMRAIWAREFVGCKQMPGEDAIQFADRLIALRDRVSISRLIHDDEARDIFRNGLPLELKNQVDNVEIALKCKRLPFEETVTISGSSKRLTHRMPAENRVVMSQFALSALIRKDEPDSKDRATLGDVVSGEGSGVNTGAKQWRALQAKINKMKNELKEPRHCTNTPRTALRCPYCDSTDKQHRWKECASRCKQESFLATTVPMPTDDCYVEESDDKARLTMDVYESENSDYDGPDSYDTSEDEFCYGSTDDLNCESQVIEAMVARRSARAKGEKPERAKPYNRRRPSEYVKPVKRSSIARPDKGPVLQVETVAGPSQTSKVPMPRDASKPKPHGKARVTSSEELHSQPNATRNLIMVLVQAPHAKGNQPFLPSGELAQHQFTLSIFELSQLLQVQSDPSRAAHAPRRAAMPLDKAHLLSSLV
ncbi:hypothetical protein THASP1DRAFT_32634 [Thamnocephalis sphaerospora]|uniref:Uncharacterized protein n=1 Tax=Thamnocephalis sphaerospora TaxID=78915 RepID=A0A4V1IVX0_9FUNG|nr:hypothetical protein THASP1DRAFT_32634 [Thamnocephalis sphaerospora]|eukprot:RKP05529.1 hypothetical protein THASP1DRAFT_32634 [Thamnocephalis sphaerospora]